MPYPSSPFRDDFNNDNIIPSTCFTANKEHILREIKQWLCQAPLTTTIRFNATICPADDIMELIRYELHKIYQSKECQIPKVYLHKTLHNVVIVDHSEDVFVDRHVQEVIVDPQCGAAILRGAHLFAPGVIGMTKDCVIGDRVSIYVDVSTKNKCKKGYAKTFDSNHKILIANGVVKMNRMDLFSNNLNNPSGVAVEITTTISGAPSLNPQILLEHGALLQNLPSIVCVECLNIKPGDVVLDMCASPGGKTSHIAQILNGTGMLIAIDKTPLKVQQLQKTITALNCKGVQCFVYDSTKLQSDASTSHMLAGPPFLGNTFDKILLDAPCSATGNRPQLLNTNSDAILGSFIPLQRKLFATAIDLLKVGGILVYSTCSIAIPENERIVTWALKKFPVILLPCEPNLTTGGFTIEGLENPHYLQRFGPYDNVNSIGFFIAKFKKIE